MRWFEPAYPVPFFCVVGSPIGHSKSPLIHAAFARQFDIALRYDRIEVRPGELAEAVAEFRAAGGRGMNITVPLKEEAWSLAGRRAPRAALCGAANTLWFEADAVAVDNTDGAGLVRDLANNHGVVLNGRRVLLIGAGGAARGVLPALLEAAPAAILVTNRTAARAAELAAIAPHGAPVSVLAWGADAAPCDLVINATSLSLQGDVPIVADRLIHAGSVCYDMMYGNEPTAFLRWATARGVRRTFDGLGMLVEQAAVAFAIWHGRTPATAPVIAALRQGATP